MTSLPSKQERKELHVFELLLFISDEGTPMQYKDIISPGVTIINSTPMLPELTEEELDFFREAVREEWRNLDNGSNIIHTGSTKLTLGAAHTLVPAQSYGPLVLLQ